MSAPENSWLDWEAGPVVRPYAVTKGRTTPAPGSYVGLLDVVTACNDLRLPPEARINREHRRILNHCQQPITVVDVASDTGLPVGVVRVLLGDLIQQGALRVVATSQGPVTSERLLKDVLNALQSL
jgi:hypothetical protein